MNHGRATLQTALILAAVAVCPGARAADPCVLLADGAPVEGWTGLSVEVRCRLSTVVNAAHVSSTIGPRRTPISPELNAYLLDHPDLAAGLMERLGMGRMEVVVMGPRHYRVKDGDGAEGAVTVILAEPDRRLYLIEGSHRSRLLPTIAAKTAAWVRTASISNPDRPDAVETTIVAYTRFDEGLVSALVTSLKPLAAWVVRHALEKELAMTHELGVRIAGDPGCARRAVAAMPLGSADARGRLLSLIPSVPSPPPSHPTR
ncbi:hypothetical protein [Candidatus Nitrospira bockiana]